MDGWEKQIEQKVAQLPYGIYRDIKWDPIWHNWSSLIASLENILFLKDQQSSK